MKLFRSKDRVKSSKDSGTSHSPSPSSTSTPTYSPKPSKKEDKDKDKGGSASRRSSTTSIQVSFANNTATIGDNSSDGMGDSKKHNIRIGDTRFYGRVLFRLVSRVRMRMVRVYK